jgi:hypothetical protein
VTCTSATSLRPPEAGDTGTYADVGTGLVTACLPESRLRTVKAGCSKLSRSQPDRQKRSETSGCLRLAQNPYLQLSSKALM